MHTMLQTMNTIQRYIITNLLLLFNSRFVDELAKRAKPIMSHMCSIYLYQSLSIYLFRSVHIYLATYIDGN